MITITMIITISDNRKNNSNTHVYVGIYTYNYIYIILFLYNVYRWWYPINFDTCTSFADLASFPSEQQGPVPSNRGRPSTRKDSSETERLKQFMNAKNAKNATKKTMHLFWQPHQILRENLQIVAAHKQTAKNRKEADGKKTQRIRKK